MPPSSTMSHTDVHHDPAHAFMPYPAVPVPHAPTGPLAGLGFGVKDLFHIAGYPTSGGQPLLLALLGVQTRTAPAVQKRSRTSAPRCAPRPTS